MAIDPLRGCRESADLSHPGRDSPGPWGPRAGRHELYRDGWRLDKPSSRMLPASNPGAVESSVMGLTVVRGKLATCPTWQALPSTGREAPDAVARSCSEWQTSPGHWRVRAETLDGFRCHRETCT